MPVVADVSQTATASVGSDVSMSVYNRCSQRWHYYRHTAKDAERSTMLVPPEAESTLDLLVAKTENKVHRKQSGQSNTLRAGASSRCLRCLGGH